MRAFPYVCPHCGANQFVAFGKGYVIEPRYKELALPGLPETGGKAEVCIGHSLRASLCSRCLEPSIEIDIVLKEKDPTGRVPGGDIRVGFGSTIKTYYKGRIYPEAVTPIVHASVPQPLAEDYKEGWSIRIGAQNRALFWHAAASKARSAISAGFRKTPLTKKLMNWNNFTNVAALVRWRHM